MSSGVVSKPNASAKGSEFAPLVVVAESPSLLVLSVVVLVAAAAVGV